MDARRAIHGMVVSLMALTGCAEVDRAEQAEITGGLGETGVGFELAGPGGAALIVPVYVNGTGPHRFVLDTGATMTCIDAGLAERLDLPTSRERMGVGIGIGQDAGALHLVDFDSLRVGAATAAGLTGCALDLEQFGALGLEVDGLLGLNYLREFRVTVDFQTERLTLHR